MDIKNFICGSCKHYCENTNFETMGGCRAFPNGIPTEKNIGAPHSHDRIIVGQTGKYIYTPV